MQLRYWRHGTGIRWNCGRRLPGVYTDFEEGKPQSSLCQVFSWRMFDLLDWLRPQSPRAPDPRISGIALSVRFKSDLANKGTSVRTESDAPDTCCGSFQTPHR